MQKHIQKKPTRINTLKKYNLHTNSNFFLYVGRIEKRKNIDRIISAYENLPQAVKKEVRLVLASPFGNKTLEAKIANKNLENNIMILRKVPDQDLVHLYNRALCLLFVSL